MNKNKIAIIAIFIMTLLSFCPVVKAESPITAFGECAYNFTKGSDKMVSKYMSGSNMSFYFTEVSFKKDSTTGKLFVKDSSSPDYYSSVSGLGSAKGYGLSSTDSMDDLGNAQTTFKKAYEANGGNCPKTFLLKKSSDSDYLPYFTNDDSTTYCGSNNDNCLSVGQLSGTGSTVKVYPSEKTWNFDVSGEGSCNGAHVVIRIDAKGKLVADISYPKSSTYYEESAKKTVTVSVDFGHSDCGSEEAYCQLNYIKNLVTSGTIKKSFIRGDDGNEKVNFNDGGWSSNSCDLTANWSATPTYSCTKYDDVKSTVISKQNEALAASKSIDDVANKYLTFNRSSDTYSSKSYSTVTDATTLSNTASEINKALKDSKFSATSTSYIDYLNGLISGKTLCTDAEEQVKSILSSYSDLATKKAAEVTALQDTLTKIKDRLTALGETDKAAEVDGYITNAQTVASDITSVSAKARASYLSDQKFSIGEIAGATCGVISKDLQEFLQTIIDYIRIAGIVLAVILGILDYIKVIFGNDEKQTMSKANKNFSTRLIAVALLFLIPALITFIVGLFNILGTGDAGTCGIN